MATATAADGVDHPFCTPLLSRDLRLELICVDSEKTEAKFKTRKCNKKAAGVMKFSLIQIRQRKGIHLRERGDQNG